VLIGKRQPDDFEPLVFDGLAQPRCSFALLVGPKPVTLDKTQRVTSESNSNATNEIASYCSSLRGSTCPP